jgi:hypothetical protein
MCSGLTPHYLQIREAGDPGMLNRITKPELNAANVIMKSDNCGATCPQESSGSKTL